LRTTGRYYVDKTFFVDTLLRDSYQVMLFKIHRRSAKSLFADINSHHNIHSEWSPLTRIRFNQHKSKEGACKHHHIEVFYIAQGGIQVFVRCPEQNQVGSGNKVSEE